MSASLPLWLPELLSISGEPSEIIDTLYATFRRDFKNGRPVFRSLPVWWDRRTIEDSRDEGFWHIVTQKDHATGYRLLDNCRAKRLAWARAAIDNAGCQDVTVFDYVEGDCRARTYLWIKDADYVVILEEQIRDRPIAYRLITAFCLDGPKRRAAMQRKCDDRRP